MGSEPILPSQSKSRGRASVQDTVKWRKGDYVFDKQPFDIETEDQKLLWEKIGSYTPLQLWECFFDEAVMQMIVEQTNTYVGKKKMLLILSLQLHCLTNLEFIKSK